MDLSKLTLPLLRESRLALELTSLLRDTVLRGEGVSHGGGQPVLLIPGFLAGDDSLGIMAGWLKATGHSPQRAGIRANVGCSGSTLERLEDRLEQLVERNGARAAVVGHSRGGAFAKVLANRRPELVSGVITLGSTTDDTFAVHPVVRVQIEAIATLGRLGVPGLFSPGCVEGDCCASFWEAVEQRLDDQIGYVAVYSRSDGIVRWQSCLDPDAENVEVESSHCGMAVHADVFRVVANSLEEFRRADALRRLPRRRRASIAAARRAA